MIKLSHHDLINRETGILFGLTGDPLQDYEILCKMALEDREDESVWSLIKTYREQGICLDAAILKVEKLFLGNQNYSNMELYEQQFMDRTPTVRRGRELLFHKSPRIRVQSTSCCTAYGHRYSYPVHLNNVTSIVPIQTATGYRILTSGRDKTLHMIRQDGSNPHVRFSLDVSVKSMIYISNNRIISVDDAGTMMMDNVFGTPFEALIAENPSSLQKISRSLYSRLVHFSTGSVLELWKYNICQMTLPVDAVTATAVLPCGKLLTASKGQSVLLRTWAMPDGSSWDSIYVDYDKWWTPKIMTALSDNYVAIVYEETPQMVNIIELSTGSNRHTLSVKYPIHALLVNLTHLVAGLYNGSLVLWNIGSLSKEPVEMEISLAPITVLCGLPDGGVACGDQYGMLHVLSAIS